MQRLGVQLDGTCGEYWGVGQQEQLAGAVRLGDTPEVADGAGQRSRAAVGPQRERLRGRDRGHQVAGKQSTSLLDGAGLDAQRPDHVRGTPEKLASGGIADTA